MSADYLLPLGGLRSHYIDDFQEECANDQIDVSVLIAHFGLDPNPEAVGYAQQPNPYYPQ
jgi:hypothetical protein